MLTFLNMENAMIGLNGHSLSDSTQDNGICVQSSSFDYLLDMENHVITVSDGEIYVPVCYRQEYDLKEGEEVKIGEKTFLIAGFLRDSQMNSMMSSSKRFLVSAADYERLKAMGSEEYLIEFLLDGDAGDFATAYTDAGLPANGPAVTKPLIRMMNALSDGLMILVILLASIVLVLIAMLCIRFTLLTQLEADRREIGAMKAIGIGRKQIRTIYFSKYVMLSGLGALAGLVLVLVTESRVAAHMQELYGAPEKKALQLLADAGISAKAVDIQKYVENTYGQTIREVRMAAVVALIVAVLVMLVVVVLFTRLLVAKDRKDISLRKAIGFSSEKVQGIYLARFVPVAGGGMVNNGVFCKTHIA